MLDINDDGAIAFNKLFPKLKKLYNERLNNVLNDNAWHISLILNTFNTYYCYDVNYRMTRDIKPIFIKSKEGYYTRLMCIELHIDDNDNREYDTFLFTFEYIDNDNPILTLNYNEFLEQYGKVSHIILSDMNKLPQIDMKRYEKGNDIINNKQRMIIIYGIDGKNDVSVLPYHCVIFKNPGDGSNYRVLSTKDIVFVNLKYVQYNRIVLSNMNITVSCVSDGKGKIKDNRIRQEQIHFIYGCSLSFINENFDNNTNEYKPKTRSDWDLSLEYLNDDNNPNPYDINYNINILQHLNLKEHDPVRWVSKLRLTVDENRKLLNDYYILFSQVLRKMLFDIPSIVSSLYNDTNNIDHDNQDLFTKTIKQNSIIDNHLRFINDKTLEEQEPTNEEIERANYDTLDNMRYILEKIVFIQHNQINDIKYYIPSYINYVDKMITLINNI